MTMDRGRVEKTDWDTEPLPDKHETFRGEILTFNEEQFATIKKGYLPEQMEDKWFIYYDDRRLYFHRSWTGFCVHVARIERSDRGYAITELKVNRDEEQYGRTDMNEDIGIVCYLVERLLLGKDARPPRLRNDDDNVVALWSEFGRAFTEADAGSADPDERPDR